MPAGVASVPFVLLCDVNGTQFLPRLLGLPGHGLLRRRHDLFLDVGETIDPAVDMFERTPLPGNADD